MPQQLWLSNYIYNGFLGDAAGHIRASLPPGAPGLFIFTASRAEADFLAAYLRFSFQASGQLIAPDAAPLFLIECVDRLEAPETRRLWRDRVAQDPARSARATHLWIVSPEHLRIWKTAGLMAPDRWSELSAPGLDPESFQRWVRHLSASNLAGGATWSPEAYRQLHRASRGLPTSVQLLLHESLALAQKSKTAQITPDIVQYAMEDIALKPDTAELFAHTPGLAFHQISDWRASLADLLAERTLQAAAPDASAERLAAFLSWPQACALALGDTSAFDALETARALSLQRPWDEALALISETARGLGAARPGAAA
jgi:hypothetical protein